VLRLLTHIYRNGKIALLDFPDELSFSECAVRHTTKKTLLIRNIGNRKAVFNIRVDPPFSIHPEKGLLEANATMQANMHFSPEVITVCHYVFNVINSLLTTESRGIRYANVRVI
jgi:hypothetical protein